MSEVLLKVVRPMQPDRFMPNNEQNIHALQHSIRYGKEQIRIELVEINNNDYSNTRTIRVIGESEFMQVESDANARISAKDAMNRRLAEENEALRKQLAELSNAKVETPKPSKRNKTEIISEL